jgi:hypothetical protein
MDRRIVTIHSPRVTDVTFTNPVPDEYTSAVMDATTRTSLDVRLDLFLAYLADEVLSQPAPAGFNTEPPPIVVRSSPTALLFVNGAPILSAIPNTGLEIIVNANWPLFRHAAGGTYYLLARDRWLASAQLERGWKAATSLPSDFNRLPTGDQYGEVRKAVPPARSGSRTPEVVFAARPTELIVIDGKPALEAIPGTAGLNWVTNTESPLFRLESSWYFLVAGRWFTTTDLNTGRWAFAKDLPSAFRDPGRSPAGRSACLCAGNRRITDGGAGGLGAARYQGSCWQRAAHRSDLRG